MIPNFTILCGHRAAKVAARPCTGNEFKLGHDGVQSPQAFCLTAQRELCRHHRRRKHGLYRHTGPTRVPSDGINDRHPPVPHSKEGLRRGRGGGSERRGWLVQAGVETAGTPDEEAEPVTLWPSSPRPNILITAVTRRGERERAAPLLAEGVLVPPKVRSSLESALA
jgi:hypothetical protein